MTARRRLGRGRPTAPIVRCGGPIVRWGRPGPSAVVPRPEVPCPRSVRSAPCATTRRPSATSGLVVAPPYDVIDADRARAPARAPPGATSSASTCRAEEPGDEPDDRYRRAARTLAAWRSDGTLHKDPHPSIYVYEQTYRVPGHGRRARPARVLRPAAARAFGPGQRRAAARADAGRPAGGPLQAAARDRRQHEPGRRRCTTTRPATAGAIARDARPAGPPTSTSSTTTASAIGCGPCRPMATGRRRSSPRCSPRPRPGPSRSPTATIATRRRCAIATSGGCRARARRTRRSTTC